MNDEQGTRIKENLAEYWKNLEYLVLEDFEEVFEDRDPFEFL